LAWLDTEVVYQPTDGHTSQYSIQAQCRAFSGLAKKLAGNSVYLVSSAMLNLNSINQSINQPANQPTNQSMQSNFICVTKKATSAVLSYPCMWINFCRNDLLRNKVEQLSQLVKLCSVCMRVCMTDRSGSRRLPAVPPSAVPTPRPASTSRRRLETTCVRAGD